MGTARQRFDLILMDIQMPVMDGVDVTRRIRNLPQPFSEVPIVALTADALVEHRATYMEAGLADLSWNHCAPSTGLRSQPAGAGNGVRLGHAPGRGPAQHRLQRIFKNTRAQFIQKGGGLAATRNAVVESHVDGHGLSWLRGIAADADYR